MEYHSGDMPDDLEIASIGSLYVGPWDKKYWSCSRGKDRYPYPLGYRAIRTHAGSICQMEVCEGLKGPLFVISSVDGSSFSGQTLDIAWDNFQKNCPKVKNWNGKRFSNKSDGAELFGFKNSSIQRLLRELVNTTQGRSLPSSCCNESKNKDQIHSGVSNRSPSLSSALEEQRDSGKKIQMKRNARKDMKGVRPKKVCHQGLQNNLKMDISQRIEDLCPLSLFNNAMQSNGKHITSHKKDSTNKENFSCYCSSLNDTSHLLHATPSHLQCQKEINIISSNISQEIKLTMQGKPEVNCHSVLASNMIPMVLDCSDSVVDKHVVSQQNDCVEIQTQSFSPGLDNSNTSIKTKLDRCLDTENKRCILASPVPKDDCRKLNALACFSDVRISETCDPAIGEVAISVTDNLNENSVCMTSELVVANPLPKTFKCHSLDIESKSGFDGLTNSNNMEPFGSAPRQLTPHDVLHPDCIPDDGVYQRAAKDSLSEELPEAASSDFSGASSENVDLYLAGQELAKSMMTFLLPQAVPLLKKTYARRRSRARFSEGDVDSLTGGNSADPRAGKDHFNNIMHQGELEVRTLAQLPEKTVKDGIDVSKALPQVCPFDNFNSYNLNLPNEPFMKNESSKDPKFIIPDSFENDIYSYRASRQEYLSMNSDDSDTAFQNDIIGNSDTSSLSLNSDKISDLEYFSHNDANSIALTVNKKNELANSMITVESAKPILPSRETAEEIIVNNAKNSNHFTGDHSCLDVSPVIQSYNSLHFKQESKHYAEEGSLQAILGECLSKAEDAELNDPTLNHNLDKWIDKAVTKEVIESHDESGFIKERPENYNLIEHDNVSLLGIIKGEPVSDKNIQSLLCSPKAVLVTGKILTNTVGEERSNGMLLSSVQCTALPEALLRRNLSNFDAPELNSARKSLQIVENYQSSCINYKDSRVLARSEVGNDKPKFNTTNDLKASELDANCFYTDAVTIQSHDVDKNITGIANLRQSNCSFSCDEKATLDAGHGFSTPELHSLLQVKNGKIEVAEQSRRFTHSQLQASYKKPLMDSCSDKNSCIQPATNNSHKEFSLTGLCKETLLDNSFGKRLSWNIGEKIIELVGCYLHPEPVLSMLLTTSSNQLQLCVLSGFPDRNIRHIFMYSVPIQSQRKSCPSFLGYTSLLLPLVRNQWNSNIPFERPTLQLAPNGQSLIFVGSIKAPRCRKQKICCLCSNCKSESSEETTIDVVHIKFGFVSIITKMITHERISCILVCEPSYLIAVEENGELHVWVMNVTWSGYLEEFMLPSFDHISPIILELKRIPNCDSLIIGHNGLGDFGIWEISRRSLLAKISSPGSTIFQFIPVSVFNWQMSATFTTTQSEEHKLESILKSTCKLSLGSSFEDISIILLISTAPDLVVELETKELGTSFTGLWRLALLNNNMMTMGKILDPRATAVGALADRGIIGTSDGFLYIWELSSGRKLGDLTSVKCGVSCVAIDSKSGALAVAGTDGSLQLFIDA